MPSEDFDKKVKEAAEHHSASFEEKSWEKMKVLLDKYLPEKKDRRRYIVFLFFFLLLGSAGIVLMTNPFGKTGSQAITEKENNAIPGSTSDATGKKVSGATNVNPDPETTTLMADDKKELTESNNTTVSISASDENNRLVVNPIHNKKTLQNPGDTPVTEKNKIDPAGTNKNQLPSDNPVMPTPVTVNEKQTTGKTEADDKAQTVSGQSNDPVKDKPDDNKITEAENKPETKEVKQEPVAAKKPEAKKTSGPKLGFLSRLAVTLSAGPELSYVRFEEKGKVQLAYGAGLAYAVSNRFIIRSGFYVANKVYTAGPGDYNPPSNFWAYYPNLKQIDADCKVYEIPVNLDYLLCMNAKQSWFASAGVSSLFMKKETYDYLFKPPYSSQYVTYSHTYKNENRHWFSMLSISGGFTRKLNNVVSLRAESYTKIPLTGIGYGKIKLSGGGILLTAIINPFTPGKSEKK